MTVVALSGGIGGAKLALGLYRVLPPHSLRVIVNTGDDFDHLGVRICPDIDTVLYTLADLDDKTRGWGRADESWNAMRAFAALGAPTWFALGDGDLALHVIRTERLRSGATLTQITDELRTRLAITADVLPMTDARVATRVVTDAGELAFQDYFVRRRCEPRLESVHFEGATQARTTAQVLAALADPALEGIVLCPSNPYLSIDPILSVPELRQALHARRVPLVAVSPLVGGDAVKGPTAKIMRELGVALTAKTIAAHYRGLIDALIIDERDAAHAEGLGVPVFITATLMKTLDDRKALAAFALARLRALQASRH